MVSPEKVRRMCIKNNLYTRGNCAEYERLLYVLCDNERVTLDEIETIARDIVAHSEYEIKMCVYGCEYEELITMIMTNIVNECCCSYIIR